MARSHPTARGGDPAGDAFPHWFRAVFFAAVEQALGQADWQEHGAPKLAAWILAELERVAENVYGPGGAITRALCFSGDALDRVSDRLRPIFRETHGLYERTPGYTVPWMVEQAAEGLGVRFAMLAPVTVPRFFLETLRTRLDVAASDSTGELERAIGDLAAHAPHPALRSRIRELQRTQPLIDILREGLTLEEVLGVRATDDTGTDASVLAAALSAEARPYRPVERFVVGEVLEHPKLGRGLVIGLAERKITVRFGVGERVLVHAGA